MKKHFIVLILISFSTWLCGCTQKPVSNEIKIGIFESLSGENESGGMQEYLGIQYANSLRPTVTIQGIPYTIRFVVKDNGSTDSGALAAANDLVQEGVSAVIGSYGSQVCIAGGAVFSSEEIPAVGCSCTNEAVTQGNPYYFRIANLDGFQGKALASFVRNTLGFSKAYVLMALGRDYGAKLARSFEEAFVTMGGTIIDEILFPPEMNSFGVYLDQAVRDGAEVIFAPTSYLSGEKLIRSSGLLAESNLPLLSGDAWDAFSIAKAQKDSGNTVYFTSDFDEDDRSEKAYEFVVGYKAWLNADPDRLSLNGDSDYVAAGSALAFDAYMVVLDAIESAGSSDPRLIRDALQNVHRAGATGEIRFNENGDAIRNTAIVRTINDGEFEFVTLQTVE